MRVELDVSERTKFRHNYVVERQSEIDILFLCSVFCVPKKSNFCPLTSAARGCHGGSELLVVEDVIRLRHTSCLCVVGKNAASPCLTTETVLEDANLREVTLNRIIALTVAT